jgi:hypothetical protein
LKEEKVRKYTSPSFRFDSTDCKATGAFTINKQGFQQNEFGI